MLGSRDGLLTDREAIKMDFKYLLYETKEKVATIILNRPERKNAISPEMRAEIMAALRQAEEDSNVKVVVLRGEGSCFSAGADFSPDVPGQGRAGAGRDPQNLKWWVQYTMGRVTQVYFVMRDMTKPIIAAVHGHCLGVALELVLACDLVVAADDAQFGAPEVRHGSIVATQLPFHVGLQKARELYFTGDCMDAEEAHRTGLVIHVVPRGELIEETTKLANRISHIPGESLFFNKLQMNILADDMGYLAGMRHAALADAMCHFLVPNTETDAGVNLREIAKTQGVRAFIKAREAPFPEDQRPFIKKNKLAG